MPRGYTKPLYILPFDHRASFARGLLGLEGELTVAQRAQICELKEVIYRGFEFAVANGVPREAAAVLVDEAFGDLVLKEAVAAGYVVCMPVEKSGQAEFDFEYGSSFAEHVEVYKPTFVKVLVRYNPEGDAVMNQRQLARLRKVSDYCAGHDYLFLAEVLVPPTEQQLMVVTGDTQRYERELRPSLTLRLVQKFQVAGVEPDVWKLEGFSDQAAYAAAVAAMRAGSRGNVSMVMLGRGQDAAAVETWLKAARGVEGVIGFAIGRTVFWEPLKQLLVGTLTHDQAAEAIAQQYRHFYDVFRSA